MAVTRVTGMYSGFDTDQLVKDMMKAEQSRVDKVKADKQLLEWKQEDYRSIITQFTDFQSGHFDVLNSDTNLTSKTMFSEFSTTVESGGVETSAVSVEGTSSTKNFSHTIGSISQLATKDEYISSDLGFTEILSDSFNIVAMPSEFKISLTVDGVTKTLTFDKASMDTQDIDGFEDALQDEIEDKFGSEYRDIVSISGDKISFKKPGTSITTLEYPGSEPSLWFLGIDSGSSSATYKDAEIGTLLGLVESDLTDMTIDGKTLSDLGVTLESSISQMTSAINKSSLDVEISYNELSDNFEIKSTKEGVVNDLDLSDKFKEKFKFDTGTHNQAQNAIVEIDGEAVIKSNNTFILEGVKYTLNSVHTSGAIDVSIDRDVDAVYGKLEKFVEDYNKIIEDITKELNEKTYRDYRPLTTEERAELSEDEVKSWEEKSRSGLLKNDSILTDMLSSMRAALYSSVEGVGISLYDIGITTSTDYKDNGKLVIDETKLKESLANDYESVVDLFTSESDYNYGDTDNRSTRYSENGLANRIADVINDGIRITRSTNGQRGSLIERAGLPGDTSTSTNTISREIQDYSDRIEDILKALSSQEERYYSQFAAMESALAEMQSQSDAFASQLPS